MSSLTSGSQSSPSHRRYGRDPIAQLMDLERLHLVLMQELLDTEPRPPSMAECMEKVKSVEGITDELIVVAAEAMKYRENRFLVQCVNDRQLSLWLNQQSTRQTYLRQRQAMFVAQSRVPSFVECMEKVKSLEGITVDLTVAALEAVKDLRNRECVQLLEGRELFLWVKHQMAVQDYQLSGRVPKCSIPPSGQAPNMAGTSQHQMARDAAISAVQSPSADNQQPPQ